MIIWAEFNLSLINILPLFILSETGTKTRSGKISISSQLIITTRLDY